MHLARFPSPSYVIDLGAIRANLGVLREVRERAGCKVLLALKAFAMWRLFPLIRESLDGTCASGPWEARLGREEFGGEVHAHAPAFSDNDFEKILPVADHISFNSLPQWNRFRERALAPPSAIRCGLRINPEHSTGETAIYDPCAPGSRLGVRAGQLDGADLSGISGFHCHTLCEQNADALVSTLEAVEEKFGDRLPGLEWFNMGGGHHITRPDYDVDLLVSAVRGFREKFGVDVYLEPGEAIALNPGILVASVLDIVDNEVETAILDVSATAHMPDVFEMPYRPDILGAGEPGQKRFTYLLGGHTCLAGDVIGCYSFEAPLAPGDRLAFLDMAHYTMVKNTTFNGVRLPSIVTFEPDGDIVAEVRRFGYADYRGRLS